MVIEKSVLRKAQMLLLEGLKEIDRICNKHNINYWIDGGTLLGAKRHGGFIPWDDDIDICMIREDYNKFIKISDLEINKEKFFLQTAYSDPDYNDFFCRLKILGTKVASIYTTSGVNGLCVDILVFDKYSKNFLKRKLECMLSVLCRIKVGSKFPISRDFRVIIAKILGPFLSKNILLKLIKSLSNFLSKKTKDYVYSYGIEASFHKIFFKEEILFPIDKLVFEGRKFNCPKNVDEYLKQTYGPDYMIEPPEKERKIHHHSIELG